MAAYQQTGEVDMRIDMRIDMRAYAHHHMRAYVHHRLVLMHMIVSKTNANIKVPIIGLFS